MDLHPIAVQNLTMLKLQLHLEHRSNWQDGGKRWARRNKFYRFLRDALLELGIVNKMPDQPVLLAEAQPSMKKI